MSTALQTTSAEDLVTCKAIKALNSKLEHGEEKVEQYKRAIGEHLKALHVGKDQKAFLALVREHVGYSKSRTYQLLGIANGTKTEEQVREDRRERDQRRIAKDRPTVGQNADGRATAPSTSTNLAVRNDDQADDDHQAATAPAATEEDADGSRLHELRRHNLALTDEVETLKLQVENLQSEVSELKEKLAVALTPAIASPTLAPDEADTPAATTKPTKHEQALAVVRAHPDLSAKTLMGMNLPELKGISLPTLKKARRQITKEGGATRARRGAAPPAVVEAPQTTSPETAQVTETTAPDPVPTSLAQVVTATVIPIKPVAPEPAPAQFPVLTADLDPNMDMPACCERVR